MTKNPLPKKDPPKKDPPKKDPPKKDLSKKDEKETTKSIFIRPKELKVKFGDKDVIIGRMITERVVKLIAFFSEHIQGSMKKSGKKMLKCKTEMEQLMVVMNDLGHDNVIKLLSIILPLSEKEIKDQFIFADALDVLISFYEIEDVKKLFFQAMRMAEIVKRG